MRAIVFDKKLRFTADYPVPGVRPGEALIRVLVAGVCATDMEIFG